MKSHINRRLFLKRAAVAAGALTTATYWSGPNLLLAANAGKKLNCAVIGCGGRGAGFHLPYAADENLVALVDPDETRFAAVQKVLKKKEIDPGKVQTFSDYRRMFDKVGKQLDAVFIASPNHHHAPPAMIAMQSGINVFCEKPLCHDIGEARRMREMARKYKVATQMGNQGHNEVGYRLLCEYVWAGAFGHITEAHCYTDRSNGGRGPRPAAEAPPAGMHWDEWIGPAPYRNFHIDIHPHEWHGWYDFGNGSLGNMACHVMDGVYWALKVEHPTSIEVEEINGGTDERCPTGTRIRWDIPARGDMPPLKVYWYDGRRGADDPGDSNRATKGTKGTRILPPLMAEMLQKYPEEELDKGSGTFYVAEKGIIHTGCYGGRMHILPIERMREIPTPPKVLSRPKNIMVEFLDACRVGKTETEACFEYGTRLTEFTHLGNLAQLAGLGKKVEWDGPNMRVTNMPELNQFIQREVRRGWEV